MEQHLARSLGFSQLTIGVLLVVLTGSLPLTSLVESKSISSGRCAKRTPAYKYVTNIAPSGNITPFSNAAILVSTLYHGAYAFSTYVQYNSTGQMGYLVGAVGYSIFGSFGLWCLMFGGDKGHISKRTGADKRTSGFPFKNAEADKRQPKEL